jgi:hypothetical protein
MNAQAQPDPDTPAARRRALALPLALLLLAALLFVVGRRYEPPPPKEEAAPAGVFSAGRARAVLRRLLGDQAPHPVGSRAHDRVRDRILAELRRLGYSPRVQQAFSCNERQVCAPVENVVTAIPGREHGAAVMLAAHYDSVRAGPGAADDMSGVAAILEIARLLRSAPAPRHTIVLLIDDGEELGLLGAAAFTAKDPAAAQVRAVVNLEARGSSGPSLMFETSDGNRSLIQLYAGAERPVTSSVFETIYHYLPNRTDFTRFKQAGMQGLNLAFIGGPVHYHTRQDDLGHASAASLQHQGDHALAAIRALAATDLPARPRGNAVFFDLLAFGLVWWPAAWSSAIACLALLLVASCALRILSRGALGGGPLAWGVLAWLGMLLASALAGFVFAGALGTAGALAAPWAAHPLPLEATFWLIGLASVALVASLAARRAGFAGMWAGVWIGWSVVGLLLAVALPGFCFLFLVPALAAALSGLLLAWRGTAWETSAAILPALAAAVLWFPLLAMLYEGVGAPLLGGIALMAGIVFSPLAPVVALASRGGRRALIAAAAVATVISALAAAALPPFTPDSPAFLSLTFDQDADSGAARWLASTRLPLPPALRKAAPFEVRRRQAFPWSQRQDWTAAAPPLDAAAPPELTVLADAAAAGRRRLRVRLRSPRGAPIATLVLPRSARVESATVAGQIVPPPDPGVPPEEWSLYFVVGLPPAGVEIELVLGETAPQVWYVSDRSDGLTPAGAPLLAARTATRTPFGDGDTTVVHRQRRI